MRLSAAIPGLMRSGGSGPAAGRPRREYLKAVVLALVIAWAFELLSYEGEISDADKYRWRHPARHGGLHCGGLSEPAGQTVPRVIPPVTGGLHCGGCDRENGCRHPGHPACHGRAPLRLPEALERRTATSSAGPLLDRDPVASRPARCCWEGGFLGANDYLPVVRGAYQPPTILAPAVRGRRGLPCLLRVACHRYHNTAVCARRRRSLLDSGQRVKLSVHVDGRIIRVRSNQQNRRCCL